MVSLTCEQPEYAKPRQQGQEHLQHLQLGLLALALLQQALELLQPVLVQKKMQLELALKILLPSQQDLQCSRFPFGPWSNIKLVFEETMLHRMTRTCS